MYRHLKSAKSRRRARVLRTRIVRELQLWAVILPIAFTLTWLLLYSSRPASAVVSPLSSSGAMFYGDITNAGIMRARIFTSPSTWAAEINGITGSASNILHVVARVAPTREEIMIGNLKVDGRLDIDTCTTACDAIGDYTSRWNHASVSGTQDCDTSPTAGACNQPFDLAYESLNGKAMVVYAGDGADGGTTTDAGTVYYAEWNGSSWSPNSTPGTPGTSNDITLPGAGTGTPRWIRVISEGDLLDKDRSNRLMLLVADSNDDLFAFYWDGSAWDSGNTLSTNIEGCGEGRCFDGAWSKNNAGASVFVAAYSFAEGPPVNDIEYNRYTVGSGWGTEAQAFTTSSASAWVQAAPDPTSTRVVVVTSDDGDGMDGSVWRSFDTTDGWSPCSGGGCPDSTIETTGSQQATFAFERFSGQGILAFNDADTTAGDSYMTYAAPLSWGSTTATGMVPADDPITMRAWTNPNNDDVMMALVDIDCDLDAQQWNGASLDTAADNLETSSSVHNGDGAGDCTINGAAVDGMASNGFDFAYKIYTPWQRNWRFYSGSDTASVPTTALANENTAPTGFSRSTGKFRLRVNYAERGRSVSNTEARKKLQYTYNCNPNTALEVNCSWTDVDDSGGSGSWRFADIACSPTDCADNTLLTGTVLTGTNGTCSVGLGCGTWVEDKDAAGGTNMDHTAQSGSDTVQESEWIVEANGALPGRTYYFRLYNVDLDTPIYREQDADDCGGGSAQCTYPSLVTDGLPTTNDLMRHGAFFLGGIEQTFYWVD